MTEGGPDPLYAAARRVTLDALEAVEPFRDSLVLVGAQAVYLRTEQARLAVAPFTMDGDIAIDPSSLPPEPAIETVLTRAGFVRTDQPGRWARQVRLGDRHISVCVDFMVPETVAPGTGRRSVELAGHDRLAARRALGLEASLVDHSPMRMSAIDPADGRQVTAEVAGPAALVVAKVHKISERVRSGRHRRTPVDKDAGDIYRLVQITPVADMATGFRLAFTTDTARTVTDTALQRLEELFGMRSGVGVEMAVRAVGISGEAPETIAAALTAYVAALLAHI
jgi:hypothetical protein